MEISPALLDRVDAGIEWANENIPDWREHVDPTKLDMSGATTCFLGQYWDGKHSDPDVILPFYRAQGEYFGGSWDRTEELGFSSTDFHYTDLTAAWQQKFREIGHGQES